MKSIADVVAELTKAAADVKTLSEGERLRLLSRALITIEEGGGLLGEPTWLRESAEAMDIVQAGGNAGPPEGR